jgi:Protein of unknown function (DUF3237)
MRLEPLFTMHADLKPPQIVGRGPFGTRQIFEVTGGHVDGAKLRGEVLTCGGDWLLADDGGVARLDVRATLRTHDGALVYVQYPGVLVMNEKVGAALAAGGATEYADTYFVTQLRFETGDERYRWLNALLAIGEGRLAPNAVEYRVFACHPG